MVVGGRVGGGRAGGGRGVCVILGGGRVGGLPSILLSFQNNQLSFQQLNLLNKGSILPF